MPNATDRLADSLTDRTVQLDRLKAGIQRDYVRSLRALEDTLAAKLQQYDPNGVSFGRRQERLRVLFREANQAIAQTFRDARAGITSSLSDVAKIEARAIVKAATDAAGVNLLPVAPDLRRTANNVLVNGAPARELWQRQRRQLQAKFADTVRSGMLRGQTTDEITRRIRGTRAKGFADGIMHGAKTGGETIIRSAVQQAANLAHLEVAKANGGGLKAIQWVATLDERTSTICLTLHGKQWEADTLKPIGHDHEFPGPTAHFNCRSTQVFVFKKFEDMDSGKVITTEDGGSTNAAALADKTKDPAAVRSALDGKAAADLSAAGWLKRKSAAEQDALLGKEKARLFRAGKITLDDLTDQRNRPLTLDELREQ